MGHLDPRVAPRVYERDGFTITFWTYYEPQAARELGPTAYADALSRLHLGMQRLDVTTPHFADRVREAQLLVGSRDRTPELDEADRDLLVNTLTRVMTVIAGRGAAEQLLHGEPHPGNVLNTKNGPLFIDLETACRGPVEFDLAHVPTEVSDCYAGIDHALLDDCRVLVLAMLAAWRSDPEDRFPGGSQARPGAPRRLAGRSAVPGARRTLRPPVRPSRTGCGLGAAPSDGSARGWWREPRLGDGHRKPALVGPCQGAPHHRRGAASHRPLRSSPRGWSRCRRPHHPRAARAPGCSTSHTTSRAGSEPVPAGSVRAPFVPMPTRFAGSTPEYKSFMIVGYVTADDHVRLERPRS